MLTNNDNIRMVPWGGYWDEMVKQMGEKGYSSHAADGSIIPEKPAGWKPTNPKDMVGCKKVPMSTISAPVMMECAVGMLEGALKYGKHNYRDEGVLAGTYYDAVMRHMMLWWEGEDLDPDSGLSHITKAMTSLVVLRDAMIQGKFKDDRPIKTVNPDWMNDLNAQVAALIEKYPNPELPYTEIPVRKDKMSQRQVDEEEAKHDGG